MAEARMALCRSRADRILAASRSQSRVEPRISVKRKVTFPEGGARGVIDVEGTATMTVQFTKWDRWEAGPAAESSRFSLVRRFHGSQLTSHRLTTKRTLPVCTYTPRRTQNW